MEDPKKTTYEKGETDELFGQMSPCSPLAALVNNMTIDPTVEAAATSSRLQTLRSSRKVKETDNSAKFRSYLEQGNTFVFNAVTTQASFLEFTNMGVHSDFGTILEKVPGVKYTLYCPPPSCPDVPLKGMAQYPVGGDPLTQPPSPSPETSPETSPENSPAKDGNQDDPPYDADKSVKIAYQGYKGPIKAKIHRTKKAMVDDALEFLRQILLQRFHHSWSILFPLSPEFVPSTLNTGHSYRLLYMLSNEKGYVPLNLINIISINENNTYAQELLRGRPPEVWDIVLLARSLKVFFACYRTLDSKGEGGFRIHPLVQVHESMRLDAAASDKILTARNVKAHPAGLGNEMSTYTFNAIFNLLYRAAAMLGISQQQVDDAADIYVSVRRKDMDDTNKFVAGLIQRCQSLEEDLELYKIEEKMWQEKQSKGKK